MGPAGPAPGHSATGMPPLRSTCWRTVGLAIGVFTSCQGFEAADGPASPQVRAVIYDDDGRRDLFEHPDARVRELAERSSGALAFQHRIGSTGGAVHFDATSLWDRLGLCPEERFGAQPSLARCSGVLIDEDLVLTAGHCFGADDAAAAELCRATLLVFGYGYVRSLEPISLSADDLYACRSVILHRAAARSEEGGDFAVVKLDRPVVGAGRPVVIGPPPALGRPLHLIGNGAGLPTKIDSGGTVVAGPPRADYLFATTDSFEGGSGSALFDQELRLVGVQSRGARDWEPDAGRGCLVAAAASGGSELHQRADLALQALCQTGWGSPRLCANAARCGDGACAATEERASCPEDCGRSVCGDGVCAPYEREGCPGDCASLTRPPVAWRCLPGTFADGRACDCGCGAPDPDCAVAQAPVTGCSWGQVCNGAGRCEPRPPPSAANGNGATEAGAVGCGVTPSGDGPGREEQPWPIIVGATSLAVALATRWRRSS